MLSSKERCLIWGAVKGKDLCTLLISHSKICTKMTPVDLRTVPIIGNIYMYFCDLFTIYKLCNTLFCCNFCLAPEGLRDIGITFLLCEISDFRKVYWSPRSVCVSVCLSLCLSFRGVQTTPLVRSSWFFDRRCLLDQGRSLQKKLKIGPRARSRSPLLWKSDNGP